MQPQPALSSESLYILAGLVSISVVFVKIIEFYFSQRGNASRRKIDEGIVKAIEKQNDSVVKALSEQSEKIILVLTQIADNSKAELKQHSTEAEARINTLNSKIAHLEIAVVEVKSVTTKLHDIINADKDWGHKLIRTGETVEDNQKLMTELIAKTKIIGSYQVEIRQSMNQIIQQLQQMQGIIRSQYGKRSSDGVVD